MHQRNESTADIDLTDRNRVFFFPDLHRGHCFLFFLVQSNITKYVLFLNRDLLQRHKVFVGHTEFNWVLLIFTRLY